MVTVNAAASVPWRPGLYRRHGLADGIDDLPRSAFGLFRSRSGLFEADIQIRKRLILRGGRFAGWSGRGCTGTPPTLLRRGHVVMVAEARMDAKPRIANFSVGFLVYQEKTYAGTFFNSDSRRFCLQRPSYQPPFLDQPRAFLLTSMVLVDDQSISNLH